MGNRWIGFLCGVAGGVAGLFVMRRAMKLMKRVVDTSPKPTGDISDDQRSMSPFGLLHQPGESSTAALGRLGYERVLHKQPTDTQIKRASKAVHWGFGLTVAGLYGAMRAAEPRFDLVSGAIFGAGLWLLADELLVPFLGLADKPTLHRPGVHAQSLVGHLGYGVTTAMVAQGVRAVVARASSRPALP